MAIVITAGVAAAVMLLVGLLWARHSTHVGRKAALTFDGYQELQVTINGRYSPDIITVQQGVPVRLHFVRKENNPCSERVVFSHFGVDRRLPAFQETTVEFVPTIQGAFLFTCQWGMYRGKLIVTPSRDSTKAAQALKSEEKHGRSQRQNL